MQNKKVKMVSIAILMTSLISGIVRAESQDSISPTTHPLAFNISTCVKASYDGFDFSQTKWERSSKWRFAMFEKLGKGFYAPNGKYVSANYNLYESTQGKLEAAKFVWDMFNCKDYL